MKQVVVTKDASGEKFISRNESTTRYDDQGFFVELNESFWSIDGAEAVVTAEELIKSFDQRYVITYSARGLREKVEGTTSYFDKQDGKIFSIHHAEDKFSYDDKDRLSSLTHTGSSDNVDEAGVATVIANDVPESLSFTYDEEKDLKIVRHNFLAKENGGKVEIGTSTFDHFGVFLENSGYENALYLSPSEASDEKICVQSSGGWTGIHVYDAQNNLGSSLYNAGQKEASEPKNSIINKYARNENEATVSAKVDLGNRTANVLETSYSFQQLKKPTKGLSFGGVSDTFYQPVKAFRNTAYLYGRFVAFPVEFSEPAAGATLVEPSCKPEDGKVRAGAAGGEAGVEPFEVLVCGAGKEPSADGTQCISTVASCAAQNKIRNANFDCEACLDGLVLENNECVLPPCPEGKHPGFLRGCVDD